MGKVYESLQQVNNLFVVQLLSLSAVYNVNSPLIQHEVGRPLMIQYVLRIITISLYTSVLLTVMLVAYDEFYNNNDC